MRDVFQHKTTEEIRSFIFAKDPLSEEFQKMVHNDKKIQK